MRIVLDTHILIRWCSEPGAFSAAQLHALQTVTAENPAIVADITLWEVSSLVSLGRLELDRPVLEWLDRAVAPPLVRIACVTPRIADEVARISAWEHRDPADRLIVATARVFGASLLTDDERIRESELVPVV